MKVVFAILLCQAVALPTFSQEAKVIEALKSYFQNLKQGKNPSSISSLLTPDNSQTIVDFLPRFLNDTSLTVRLKSIDLLKEAALKSSNTIVRKKATRQLSLQWDNKVDINRKVFQSLKKFRAADFEESAKDSLVRFASKPIALKAELLRVIGFVGRPDDAVKLTPFSSSENTVSVRWSALLAMARLGDEEAISQVAEKARKIKVNDAAVQQLFPDLVYTRQKKIFEYLNEVIQSDLKNCESADNDNPTSILCGYRVMEQLAPAIKNYPLSLDAGGDVKTWDYKKSLEQVREWFNKNIDYQIDYSTF